jgi:hypothetical protein
MPVWEKVTGGVLNQGDLLRGIAVPVIQSNFPDLDENDTAPINVGTADVIIVSQSCDLEQRKIPFVVAANVSSLDKFEQVDPKFKTDKGRWRQVALGRQEALHMLHGLQGESGPARGCLVVDFRIISSLPLDYVEAFAADAGERWRLQSPYVENLSQAIGRFFMRVALPHNLPKEF